MRQQQFHAGDTLPCAPNMAALTAITSPCARQAIVSAKNDRTATQDFDGGRWGRSGMRPYHALEHGPANGTVADIESELKINFFFIGFHGLF
jgi:hypothetical protein